MNSDHPEYQEINPVAALATKIVSKDYREYYQTARLGTAGSFESGGPVFERAYRICRSITEDTLALIPRTERDSISRKLTELESIFRRIENYNPSHQGSNERNAYVQQIEAWTYEFVSTVKSTALLLSADPANVQQMAINAGQAATQIRNMVDELSESIKRKEKEVDGIIENARSTATKAALTGYASFFSTAADGARKGAWCWLVATGLLSGGILVWLYRAANKSPTLSALAVDSNTIIPDQLAALNSLDLLVTYGPKLAFFTVIFYLLSWCARNFKSQWHIHIVNSHRANTLGVLQSFADTTQNTAVRDSILAHASSAIFNQVVTGFVPDQSDSPHTPSVLEIFRTGKPGD